MAYVIDWVERGDHARLVLQQHYYDCVLLDRGLPQVTSDEILTAI
jgi:two-component system, OmpR family, response regulator